MKLNGTMRRRKPVAQALPAGTVWLPCSEHRAPGGRSHAAGSSGPGRAPPSMESLPQAMPS